MDLSYPRRSLAKILGSLLILLVLAACAPAAAPPAEPAAPPPAEPAAPPPEEPVSEMDALIAAAQAEGTLTTIALPHDWCNYGEVIQSFKDKYGIAVNELDPNAGSGDEIEAIKANKDNPGPQAPDVIDVGFGFGPQIVDEGLVAPYKVSTWDTIPAEAKHPDGYWYGDYYGVLAIQVNTDVVSDIPQDWEDLLDPKYAGQVALAGDPRVSNQAIQSVFAAGLAYGGTLDDAAPGLRFWADLVGAGNFVPVIANDGTFARGETPIIIQWDYLALADRDVFGDNPSTEIVIPETGVFAGIYLQAISAYAPHPNAAMLWMEHLYSDEGQLLWLKGYCHPIRYNDLVARGVIPADIAARLPADELYAQAVFPSLNQLTAARELITTQWDTVVGVDVKAAP